MITVVCDSACDLWKDQIKELGMNAFLAVGQGSVNEAKFIHLTYKSKKAKKKNCTYWQRDNI